MSSQGKHRDPDVAPTLTLRTREHHGAGESRLVLADNLPLLHSLPDEWIDLVYIDPPFATGRRRTSRRSAAAFGDGRPRSLDDYLGWLDARLREIRRVLKSTGTLYVHLDGRVVHYVKVGLDRLFGPENFRNEIVWHYNSGPRRRADFGQRHDTILRYSKTADYVFQFQADAVRVPYSPDINIPPSKRHYYHPGGKVMDDVWRVPIIPQNDRKERLGYPTQKPEVLLDIVVRASSREGDLVADFFCGSGTTLAVAAKRGRRWLGCDSNPDAIAIAARRLAACCGPPGFTVEVGEDVASQPPIDPQACGS